MASLSSPIKSTIDASTRTVSSSAISGGGRGGALVVQLQSSLVNVERNLQIQTNQNVQQTQEISSLKRTVDVLRAETTTLNASPDTTTPTLEATWVRFKNILP